MEVNKVKKQFASISFLLLLISCLTGCNSIGNKNVSLTIIYAAATILSFILWIGCILSVRKKKFWFVLLFTFVLIVNIGYTFLSISSNLQMALWANRVSYLGSVFLPPTMLMIILNVTNAPYKKHLSKILFVFAFIVFLIAASPDILPIYYKEVSFKIVDGASTLVKVYGPLHPLYLAYLLGYFIAMVTVIIRAKLKKTIEASSHAIILAIAVFVNIGVWFIEQLVNIDFEMLSVSYIISELFLLGVHLVMNENQRLREIVKQVEAANTYSENNTISDTMLKKPIENISITPEKIEFFITGLKSLTPTEKAIFEAHLSRVTSKEIMANMNIKESTLKYHNRNIYGKLGVTSRKEILEFNKHIKSIKNI